MVRQAWLSFHHSIKNAPPPLPFSKAVHHANQGHWSSRGLCVLSVYSNYPSPLKDKKRGSPVLRSWLRIRIRLGYVFIWVSGSGSVFRILIRIKYTDFILKSYARSANSAKTSVADPWNYLSGSGSADLCLWLMDPDPAIFVIDLQVANKKQNFSAYFFLKVPVHLHHFSKI